MSGWHEGDGSRGQDYVSEYRSDQQPGPQQPTRFHAPYQPDRRQQSAGGGHEPHTDEWYTATRYAEQDLWYPEIPQDEAPEARAMRREAYAEAVDATRFNLPVFGTAFLDPTSLQQLIPPRRGQVQGPGTRPGDLTEVGVAVEEPQEAAKVSVSKASRIMAMGTIVSRVTGIVRTSLIVAALGTGALSDSFNVGNNLPNMIYAIVAGGAVNAIFVPQLVRAMKDDRDGGQAFIDRLLTLTIVFLGSLTALAVMAAPLLVDLYAGGYTGAQREATVNFARYCLPQIIFYGLSVMLGQILNAKDSYGPMMWTPVLANVVQIATLGAYLWIVNGVANTPQTITGGEQLLLGFGTTLGIVLQAVTLIPYLRGVGVTYRPRFDWRGTGLGKSMTLAKWTLATVGVSTVVNWAVTFMATSMGSRPHNNDAGVGYSAYSNAITLWILPQSVITVSIVTALLPRMSRYAHTGDKGAVGDAISYSLRATGVAIVPCAFAFLAFAQQIVSILLGHGNMTPEQSHNLGYMLMAFSLGLIPYSAQFVMLRGFYAYEDTRTPFFISLWIGAANAGLAWLSYVLLGNTKWAVAGMCVAYSVSYLVGLVITAGKLNGLVGAFDGRRVLRVHVKLCVAAGIATAVGGPVGIYVTDMRGAGTIGAMAGLASGGALFLVVFLLIARAMHVQELNSLLGTVKARLGR
ncbi:murein biosynthesis integral membrane protein MurJ [Actinospica durhamensis]|uniref:Murein biosynthesis integral membrane protein MurJ n=1 Tax=Actinospica durhamensis TaxID=1508375 RepID=A0A941EMD4_9ACTN|nr:murein biosynthesis integral membrane protein MurJ [Actinospica durhamensis]MBR7834347.1 murein biosynthesis integral membrane protein MurJ [Actinospica durhamensis]